MKKSLIKKLIHLFSRDERGAFAVIFALMSLVLVASAGAVVDYSNMQQVRKRAQISIDSAALSLQDDIYTTSITAIKTATDRILKESVNDADVTITIKDPVISVSDNNIFLEATFSVPTSFLGLISIEEIKFTVGAEATRDATRLEIALVLDNSISMAGSAMSSLKSAANNAVNILYGGDVLSNNVFMAVVPFGFTVNVGPSARNASWMDNAGASAISADNFDDDHDEGNTPTLPRNRFDLFDSMNGVDWWGCVEARAYPHDTLDTAPTTADLKFIPALAPDYRDGSGGNSYLNDDPNSCQATTTTTENVNCYCKTKLTGWGSPSTSCYVYSSNWTPSTQQSCSCPSGTAIDWQGQYTSYGKTYQDSYCITVETSTSTTSILNTLSNREKIERICKYDGATPSSNSIGTGPNQYCATPPITALTGTKATVTSAINAMDANGGTNIHQGAIWGWRTLSPGLPYSEGEAYDAAVSKIMIIMTDGVNRYFKDSSTNGGNYLTAYAYPYNERLGTMSSSSSQLEDLVDDRTLETCANAKTAGIDVYTIGLGSSSDVNQPMLIACASDSTKAYFPSNPGELNAVFTSIADRLAPLRLAK